MKKLICSLVLVSGGLFITGLVPTKANAATLTFTPVGEIEKKPDEEIVFSLVLTPAPSTIVKILAYIFNYDSSELSPLAGLNALPPNFPIDKQRTLVNLGYKVLTPVKDGIGDVSASVFYEESGSSGTSITLEAFASGGDVVPVPEPLTIFGTATALGCGAIFKRKFSKKTVS